MSVMHELERLRDMIAEAVSEMSDEDISEFVGARGQDCDQVARDGKAAVAAAISESAKARFRMLRGQIAMRPVLRTCAGGSYEDLLAILRHHIANQSQYDELTMAARGGSEARIAENDLRSLVEDILSLKSSQRA